MQIIPVIDIKDGNAVAAQQGQRNSYKAIKSALCSSSTITSVINGLLSIHPFKIIYIADLNAITNKGNNQKLVDCVITNNPGIEFWVDNGKKTQDFSVSNLTNYKLVFGSENQDQHITHCRKDSILSLDFFPEKGYVGPKQLLNNSALWPKNIIIMTLDRVGKNIGPDFEKLTYFHQKHLEKNIIAAGGIRDISDLLNLKKIGIHYALVASALHSGSITSLHLQNL